MFKIRLILVITLAFMSVAHAELAQPVIQRDANGLVTITCASPGAIICYSLDGSNPDLRSGAAIYLAPVSLPFKCTVKAKAYDMSKQTDVTFDAIGGAVAPPSTAIPVTQNRNAWSWENRHKERCDLVRERKPQLIFIGDSITHFMSNGQDNVWSKYYEPRNAVNLGFGWDRTENALWRLQNGELDGYEPKVAVVMIGTNNRDSSSSASDIATGIRAICTEINKRSPKTKILLLGIFPRGEKPDDGRKKLEEINKLISALDGQNGVTYLDIGSKFLNPDGTISKDIMNDYLHPTLKGYEIWVEAMEPTLKKLLGE